MDFEKFGFMPANILIPKNEDMQKWSVVACDQYTSEPEYWQRVKKRTDGAKSTYHMIFPEIFLENEDKSERIKNINGTMDNYLNEDVFLQLENSFVYVKRQISTNKIRHGLVGMIDLEKYDFSKESKALIRATEGTVIERIPPRVEIRKNASLEIPHIMILIDDKENEVFKSIKLKEKAIYDFDLMEGGGHIQGYKIEPDLNIYNAFLSLYEKCDKENPLMFAVGDGNHSLATAKKCWENIKNGLTKEEMLTNPARYSLVEVVNIHDEALEFEPIHRVIFDCEPKKIISDMKKYFNVTDDNREGQKISYVIDGEVFDMYIKNPTAYLCVGTLQKYIDENLKNKKIDYIHGSDVVKKLSHDKNIGFILPAMDKSDLFKTILNDSVLPRKTFSMGEACDKRFYLECRKVK